MKIANPQLRLERVVNRICRGLQIVDVAIIAGRGDEPRQWGHELVDVAEAEQMMAFRANVADLEHDRLAHLLLDIQVVVEHVRCGEVLVHGEQVRRGAEAAENGLSGSDLGGDGAAGENGLGSDVVVGRPGSSGVIGHLAEKEVLREDVIELTEADADHRGAFAIEVVSHTGARREIPVVRLVETRKPIRAHLAQHSAGRVEVGKQVVLLRDHSEVVPSQSIVEGEPGD